MPPRLALVDVVCQRIRAQSALKTLRGHLRHRRRAPIRRGRARDGARAAVAGDTEDGRPGAGVEVLEERGNKQLARGGVAAGVRDALCDADCVTRVELLYCKTKGRKGIIFQIRCYMDADERSLPGKP